MVAPSGMTVAIRPGVHSVTGSGRPFIVTLSVRSKPRPKSSTRAPGPPAAGATREMTGSTTMWNAPTGSSPPRPGLLSARRASPLVNGMAKTSSVGVHEASTAGRPPTSTAVSRVKPPPRIVTRVPARPWVGAKLLTRYVTAGGRRGGGRRSGLARWSRSTTCACAGVSPAMSAAAAAAARSPTRVIVPPPRRRRTGAATAGHCVPGGIGQIATHPSRPSSGMHGNTSAPRPAAEAGPQRPRRMRPAFNRSSASPMP